MMRQVRHAQGMAMSRHAPATTRALRQAAHWRTWSTALGLLLATVTAHAQDPAAVDGGGGDGAYVDSGSAYRSGGGARQAQPTAGEREAMLRELGAPTLPSPGDEAAALLQQVKAFLESPGAGNRHQDSAVASQYRRRVEQLVRENWTTLGPLARDLYTATYDRADPDDPGDAGLLRTRNGVRFDPELTRGVGDAREQMRNLEDLLLPVLKDLKRGIDTAAER